MILTWKFYDQTQNEWNHQLFYIAWLSLNFKLASWVSKYILLGWHRRIQYSRKAKTLLVLQTPPAKLAFRSPWQCDKGRQWSDSWVDGYFPYISAVADSSQMEKLMLGEKSCIKIREAIDQTLSLHCLEPLSGSRWFLCWGMKMLHNLLHPGTWSNIHHNLLRSIITFLTQKPFHIFRIWS